MAPAHHRVAWLSAGALVLGVGAAVVGGVGTAHADVTDTGGSAASRSAGGGPPPGAARTRGSAPPAVRASAVKAAPSRPAAKTTPSKTTPSRAAAFSGAVTRIPVGQFVPASETTAPAASQATAPAARLPLTPAAATNYRAGSNLPPRIQWNANYGYCGETSFVSAGLYYGQYISQYDARAIASRNARQSLESSQLLLGVNDIAAAKAMHLTAVAKQATTASFLPWVKSNVVAGNPVVIGVFMNQSRFYGTSNLNAGDTEYDHIVTVTGVTSTRPLTGPTASYPDDVLTFNDNGLWAPGGLPQNTFNYPFATFPATRQQANAKTGPVYSLKNGLNYGIAFTGIIDLNRETVPVRLTTSTNAETPAMVNGSSTRPAAKPVTLTITVSGLTPGKTYNLYRYASMAAVPDSNFNANSTKATQKWKIVATGTTYTMTQTIMSNETAAYRAVPVTAR
jgi:hypothetical protein